MIPDLHQIQNEGFTETQLIRSQFPQLAALSSWKELRSNLSSEKLTFTPVQFYMRIPDSQTECVSPSSTLKLLVFSYENFIL